MMLNFVQSLTVGLVHHRPDDALGYLLGCLDQVKKLGHNNVYIDTFVAGGPCALPPGRPPDQATPLIVKPHPSQADTGKSDARQKSDVDRLVSVTSTATTITERGML